MGDLKDRIDQLADLMAEFDLVEASLRGEYWKIAFSKNPPRTHDSVVIANGTAPAVDGARETSAPSKPKSKAPPAPKGTPITTPMMGVFYSASSPGAPPFVKEGDQVTAGQVIGLIEAMKVFNEITSPISGNVVAVLPKNGDLVQAGDTLVLIG